MGEEVFLSSFGSIPVQMCQFHQAAIVRRYIKKKPRLQASIELNQLVRLIKKTDKESLAEALNEWFVKWEHFLNEITINQETGKSYYTHKRLRSAYRSLKTNLRLFTWYDNIEFNIPNTTNAIDGHFADCKKQTP